MNKQGKKPVTKRKRTLLRDILIQTDGHTWRVKKLVFSLTSQIQARRELFKQPS